MFAQLPAELSISVLSLLDVASISNLSLVCKSWKAFVDENESTVYHNLAVYHEFIHSSSVVFNRLPSIYSAKSLVGVSNWKSFCQRRVHIDKSWAGKASSHYVSYPSSGSTVHRIKIDEKAGFIITSFRDGGLRVSDLTSDKVLWSLPKTYVRQYAHVEYGEGFVIFDRHGDTKEVWRLAVDCHSSTSSQSKAQPDQISASEKAFNMHVDTYPHGHFKPWAVLKMPRRDTRAFRFVFPTLLVGAWDHVFLWDILSCELIQTITPIQRPNDPSAAFALVLANAPSFDAPVPRLGALDNINYVDVDGNHVFICGVNSLRVFSRASGKCILDVPATRREYGSRKYGVLYDSEPQTNGAALVNHYTVGEELQFVSTPRVIDEFVAAHVSSCGHHLVALLGSSRVVIIQNFQDGPSSVHDHMLSIQLGRCGARSKYLAIQNDRVAVANNNGLFIFSLSEVLRSGVNSESSQNPTPVVSRAPYFGYTLYLSNLTCLQLSDTGLYLNWDTSYLQLCEDDEVERRRSDDLFHDSVDDQHISHLRMPTGDLIILLIGGV
ncbi:hypothetical protein EV361DRAFT_945935 [Lentinula raphanica]|nr:hypothetical protein C8R42DRAFT_726010 [Lentinula raphanica]KAJ3773536.1 hypothetical protein FB446DRAFT_787732 [Lentinula raphanica]KAJ3975678.1 hypothetical protein EV361DRAFT_945935 [Lentinula raphanica]